MEGAPLKPLDQHRSMSPRPSSRRNSEADALVPRDSTEELDEDELDDFLAGEWSAVSDASRILSLVGAKC
jgi:hypothetical protein